MLFAILWTYTRRPRPRYAPTALFLIWYAVARIAVEFVREPDVGIGYLAFGWVTMGQLLSLPMLTIGLLLLWAAYHYRIPSGNFKAGLASPGAAPKPSATLGAPPSRTAQ